MMATYAFRETQSIRCQAERSSSLDYPKSEQRDVCPVVVKAYKTQDRPICLHYVVSENLGLIFTLKVKVTAKAAASLPATQGIILSKIKRCTGYVKCPSKYNLLACSE